jgi:signal transduction histidine kinase
MLYDGFERTSVLPNKSRNDGQDCLRQNAIALTTLMLDLHTSLIFLIAVTVVDAIMAVLIWNAHRHLPGLDFIASGFLSFAIAVGLVSLLPDDAILARNLLFNLSQFLTSEGMARFLDQRSSRWYLLGATVFTLLFWPPAQSLLPPAESLQARILAACVVSIVAHGRLIWVVWQGQRQTRLWRSATLACLLAMLAVMVARLCQVATLPAAQLSRFPQNQAWFYFMVSVGVNALFLCNLVMIGERLARDLKLKNRELIREVERRTRMQATAAAALSEQFRLRDERRRFLRLLGHEIGTPLAIVDRSAEMLVLNPASLPERVATIRNAVRRLSRLTRQIVVAERATLETLQMSRLDANSLMQEAVAEQSDDARITFVPSPVPPHLTGDHDMIVLALGNLLNNARKFSGPDLPIIATVRNEGQWVSLAVADRGIGFPEAEIAAIGQGNYRASNAQIIPGSGLGLYLVSLLMTMHGGALAVANRLEGGAIVSLRLPNTA